MVFPARLARFVILIALTSLPAACRNPFVTYPDEYGVRVDPERLHTSQRLELPTTEPTERPDARSVRGQERPDPFAGLERVELSLDQCRAWTLENNLDLEVAFRDPEIAVTVLTEEEARFEALFLSDINGSDADPGQALVYRDQFVRPFDSTTGVQIPLRTGGTASVSMPIARTQTFGDQITQPYVSSVDFRISHPLLRGAGRETNTHGIRLAALDSQIAQARTKLEVIRQIAAADRGFWLLYESIGRLAIRQEQYERATEQLENAVARYEARVGPEIEVVRAEAGVSRRLSSILFAELLIKDRQRELKRIMNHPDLDVDSVPMLQLAAEPAPVRYDLAPGELIRAAMEQRMELLELELRLAQDLSTIDFAENQKLPLFTLDYTYRVQGTGKALGRSLENAFSTDEQGWQLGLNVEVPIGNEAAEARVHRAILTRLQRLATRSAREQSIKQEVLGAIDNLQTSWERIKAATLNVSTESRNYAAEQGQYRLGLRNSTEVLDAEDRLAEAKIERINALIDYEIAQIDLAFATGMLLGATRVAW
ncbi:MAG: TolC family protein [Planctomycetota bacterium]